MHCLFVHVSICLDNFGGFVFFEFSNCDLFFIFQL